MIHKLISIIIILFVAFGAFAFDKLTYMTLDDYFKKHPEQKGRMINFAKTVSSKSVPTKIKKPITIATIYPAIQKSDYWRFSVNSMEERLKELNINYRILRYFSKPSGDFRLQASQVANAIKNRADYIAISVDNQNIKRYVNSILVKNKPKVIIQNLTTPMKDWMKNKPYLYVGFDHIEGAKIISDYYSNYFAKGAKYLMLYGPKGTVSTLRGNGFEKYSISKGFVPVAKYFTDFDSEKAYQATLNALDKHKDLSFIYACSTDIAAGASRALKERGLTGKIMLNGWGGTNLELELIKKGELDFTVMRMNDDNGVAIAEAIKLDIEGKNNMMPSVFSGEFVTVTSDMSAKQIEKLQRRAFRYSGR